MSRRLALLLGISALMPLLAGAEKTPPARGDRLPPGAVVRIGMPSADARRRFQLLTYSADGSWLVTAGRDPSLEMWKADQGQSLGELTMSGGVNAVAFSPDGKSLAVAVGEGEWIRMFTLASQGQFLPQKPIALGANQKLHVRACGSVAFSPDGRALASASWKDGAYLWDLMGRKEARILGGGNQEARTVAFASDGKTVATGSYDGSICLWETATGQERLRLRAHDDWVACVVFSPDNRLFASAGDDGTVRLWDIVTGKRVRQIPKSQGATRGVAFSPDGRLLATAGPGSTVTLWGAGDGEVCRRFEGHRGAINAVAFAPDGARLASASADGTVLIWDVAAASVRGSGYSPPAAPGEAPSVKSLQGWYEDLAGDDARRAYRAMGALIAAPEQSVPFLREQLCRRPKEARTIAQLIGDLDSDEFHVREQAQRELAKRGDLTEPALRQALKEHPSPEARRRIQQVLEEMRVQTPSKETLQETRAIEVLERIGTAEARQDLRMLTQGGGAERLTRGAYAALERLSRRKP
jgi:WD40 repeat protein